MIKILWRPIKDFLRKSDPVEKVQFITFITFRVLILISAGAALYLQAWENFIFLIFTLFLTFLPSMIERQIKVDYPGEFEVLIFFLICGSLYLGEVGDYYHKFIWWDVMLHSLASAVMAAIGFSLIFILNESERVRLHLSPAFVCVFAFCFSMTAAALWEIFEFGMDVFFGLNMQKSGLIDTMLDLIVSAVVTLLVVGLGYFHMHGDVSVFKRLEKKFFELNPRFRKHRANR